jgi:hypothetical protein
MYVKEKWRLLEFLNRQGCVLMISHRCNSAISSVACQRTRSPFLDPFTVNSVEGMKSYPRLRRKISRKQVSTTVPNGDLTVVRRDGYLARDRTGTFPVDKPGLVLPPDFLDRHPRVRVV